MDYNTFIALHSDFDIVILKQLWNHIGFWEFIDLYKNIDNKHFKLVGEIYNTVFFTYFPYDISLKNIFVKGLNIFGLLFMYLSYYQCNLILKNKDFAEEQLINRNVAREIPLNLDDLYFDTKNILYFLQTIKVLNVIQVIFLFYNYFYPEKEFHYKVIDVISNHIINNLSSEYEFLLIVHNLLIEHGL